MMEQTFVCSFFAYSEGGAAGEMQSISLTGDF